MSSRMSPVIFPAVRRWCLAGVLCGCPGPSAPGAELPQLPAKAEQRQDEGREVTAEEIATIAAADAVVNAVSGLLGLAVAEERVVVEQAVVVDAVEVKPADDVPVDPANQAAADAIVNVVSDLFGFGEAAAVAVENVEAMDQQFRPFTTSVLNAELHFIRKVCRPTPEQFAAIRKAGKAQADVIVRQLATLQKNNNNRHGVNWPSPRKLFSEHFVKVIETAQSAEMSKTYQRELFLREESRKLATVHNMVVHLDRQLALTPGQVERLNAKLTENFDEKWMSQMMVFLYPEEYFPRPDGKLVLPLLNDSQKKAWKALPSGSSISFGWEGEMNFFGEMANFEDE